MGKRAWVVTATGGVGVALIVAGLAMVYVPLALIFLGVVLTVFGLVVDLGRRA